MPSLLSSPDSTSFLNAPSTELKLSAGQSSRISCFVKLPILFCITFVLYNNESADKIIDALTPFIAQQMIEAIKNEPSPVYESAGQQVCLTI